MNPRLTRDELLRRGAAGGALLMFPSLLAACGGGGGGDEGGGELKDVLNFSNWTFYMDTEKPTTLENFTTETGIKVNYVEDVEGNEEYFAKVQGPLRQGDGIDRDIFVFTDNSRYPALLIEQGWVQKLDKSLIPNFANLIEAQSSPPFDPNREYSLPWLGGMTGIGWNENLTGPVESIEQLFEDPKLKGKVGVLTEMADTVGLVMLANGDDPTAVTEESFTAAIDRIAAAFESGQILKATNDFQTPLNRGTFAAAIAWGGDVTQLAAENPKLNWAIPKDGGMIWTDNMLIPTGGSVPTASTYMNFMYDPANSARLAIGTGYISSVQGVKEEAAKLDPDVAANPILFPDDETLSQLNQFDSAALDNDDYITRWQEVRGN
jgi:spermidine/putrescine transport system substrate-binding protein